MNKYIYATLRTLLLMALVWGGLMLVALIAHRIGGL